MKARALIIDDDGNIRRMLSALLRGHDFDVEDLPGGAMAVETARAFDPDVVFLDLVMEPGPDGLAVLAQLRSECPHLVVVMMSGKARFADAVRATKLGAVQFLEKPMTPDGVLIAAAAAVDLARTRQENRILRQARDSGGSMVGTSAALHAVRSAIQQVGPSASRVLVTGESGTGKELVARAIHSISPRSSEAFVSLNCAAIPRELVESELFGHERGAFTGATERRHGKFEMAHRGTLFLDEVGDLHPEVQAKLLRAIETGTLERVGGERSIHTDVRIVAATNRDLEQAVTGGSFRADLYYRLNVFPIVVPPLRERRADVKLLATHFVERAARRSGTPIPPISSGALTLLNRHQWPGNVRELANLMERMVIISPGTIDERVVSHALGDARPPSSVSTAGGLAEALDRFERTLIRKSIEDARGNIAEAARTLQTDRGNLYRRMRRLGLSRSDT